MSLESRVQQVADQLRKHPEFMSLLLKTLCGNGIRVAGSWERDPERQFFRLPNLSRANHNIAIIFDPDLPGQPYKWLVYGSNGPLREGARDSADEAKREVEKAAKEVGVILTDHTPSGHTVSPWFQDIPVKGEQQAWVRTDKGKEPRRVARITRHSDGTWVPSVQGIPDFQPFYRLEDAQKAVDDVLTSAGHILPPETP